MKASTSLISSNFTSPTMQVTIEDSSGPSLNYAPFFAGSIEDYKVDMTGLQGNEKYSIQLPEVLDSNQDDIVTVLINPMKKYMVYNEQTRNLTFRLGDMDPSEIKSQTFTILLMDQLGKTSDYKLKVNFFTNSGFQGFQAEQEEASN